MNLDDIARAAIAKAKGESKMTEQIEENVVEGQVQSPSQIARLFTNLDALLDFAKYARPAAFTVQSGVDENGKAVWQIVYHTQNRG